MAILISALSTLPLHGQYLHFSKKGHRLQVKYKIGDEIGFKLKENDVPYQGQILGFTDSTIVFKNYQFSIKEIQSIRVDQKIQSNYILKYNVSRVLIMVGVGLPIIEAVNNQRINRQVTFNGMLMIQAGLLMKLMLREYLPLNEKYSLTIIRSANQSSLAPDPIN